MSITWTTYWSDPVTGLYERQATLYSAASAADDGEWFSTAGLESVIILFDESDTAGYTVGGHNSATVPANSSDGFTVTSEATSDGFASLQQYQLPRWLKIHLSTVSAGTASIWVKVRGRRIGNANE